MMTKVIPMSDTYLIWLDTIGKLLDALFVELYESDGYVIAKLDILQHVRIEFPIDSPEARILKDKLRDQLKGQRVIIYRLDDDDEPLRVAIKTQQEA